MESGRASPTAPLTIRATNSDPSPNQRHSHRRGGRGGGRGGGCSGGGSGGSGRRSVVVRCRLRGCRVEVVNAGAIAGVIVVAGVNVVGLVVVGVPDVEVGVASSLKLMTMVLHCVCPALAFTSQVMRGGPAEVSPSPVRTGAG